MNLVRQWYFLSRTSATFKVVGHCSKWLRGSALTPFCPSKSPRMMVARTMQTRKDSMWYDKEKTTRIWHVVAADASRRIYPHSVSFIVNRSYLHKSRLPGNDSNELTESSGSWLKLLICRDCWSSGLCTRLEESAPHLEIGTIKEKFSTWRTSVCTATAVCTSSPALNFQ